MNTPLAPTTSNNDKICPPDYINKEIYYCDIETGAPIYSSEQQLLGYAGRYSFRPNDVTSGARQIAFNLDDIEKPPSKVIRGKILYQYIGTSGKGYMIDNHTMD